MKLMPDELKQRFKEVGDQSEMGNPLVLAKFYDPDSFDTWYATEYFGEGLCRSWVIDQEDSTWNLFYVDDQGDGTNFFGGTIKRDLSFNETRMYDLYDQMDRESKLFKIDNLEKEIQQLKKENPNHLENRLTELGQDDTDKEMQQEQEK